MAIRVAMLGQYPLDETRILGGIEAVMVPLLRALARLDDVQLDVVTCLPGVQDGTVVTQSGMPLHVLRRRRLGRVTWHARDVASIRRTVRALSPDVVHAQGLGIYAAAATALPYPHVVTAHGLFFREAEFAQGLAARWRGFMDSAYERRCLARTRNLIAISPYVEQELLRRPPEASFAGRVFPIENPVDELFFGVGDEAQEPATVLYAGRVIPRKGLLSLLHALVGVRQAVPQLRLRVAGEVGSQSEYVEDCRRFIAQQGLETSVTFLGSLSLQQMAHEYARCALLALPSKQETAPVVVAEAMAAGRAVVAAHACGMPYMLEDGQSGFLVGFDDVAGWERALTTLLADAALRRRMGRRGRELARARFHPDAVAQATRAVYRVLSAVSSLVSPTRRGRQDQAARGAELAGGGR